MADSTLVLARYLNKVVFAYDRYVEARDVAVAAGAEFFRANAAASEALAALTEARHEVDTYIDAPEKLEDRKPE